ncbi:MAG: TonB family protein [Gammaproteobacteria bacterium]|jgi:TonB family protein|nr:TonB family protein [Gammaproteobacteria bacterium]MBT3860249.1 TonB family protein [Gammaproteobacteria bacterium]MBT3987541.1 TonB family protein [Gammaproteobacteria bacterium]MBT4581721.1 TonB family protein [Gammaproteobacteria bacterium]MBT4659581.1 TonB family protein [Gammaproteobacteria bacterium]
MNHLTVQKIQSIERKILPCLAMVLLSSLAACTNMDATTQSNASDASFEVTPPPNFTRGLLARRVAEPLYPLRATNLGIEGWVMLRFSVNEDGEVISNTIQTIEEQPAGFFELSATNAARRLTFVNTRGAVVEDVRYVFRYQLDGLNSAPASVPESDIIQFREILPLRLITPPYPEVALELGLEGYVVVKFTVTASGAVQDVVVDESEPPGVFNDEAVRAAQRLRFDPRIVRGEAVQVEEVLFRFDWNLPR